MDAQRPSAQVFCPRCRGGNPPGALRCMWCDTALTTYPPVAPRQSRTWLFVGIGGALLALAVVAVVFLVSQPRSGDGGNLRRMNESINLGRWLMTVEKTELVPGFTWGAQGATQEAKGHYLKVYLTLENRADATGRPAVSDFKVRDSRGVTYSHCAVAPCFDYPLSEQRLSLTGDFAPRSPTRALAIFDVPKDASGFRLVAEGVFERDQVVVALDR